MTTIDRTTAAGHSVAGRTATTRRLLACGVAAGPTYLAVSAAQVVTRDGFDLTRHPLSLLSLGSGGWLQIANFVISGVLFVAGAVGMRRAITTGIGRTWAPRLIGFFGFSSVWAGVFVADPMDGFPATTAGTSDPTMHGILHSIAPVFAFLALIAACIVLARRYFRAGRRGWGIYSAIVGVALLAPDLLMGRDGFTLALAAAAVVGWTWVSAVAADLLRTTGYQLS
ncbi:DUF998 domain-containing protein [Rhodococcus sp. NPDC058514]|uniref:DUF998 domain-containing protein n=1 Tax=unclassified Rhodococcus (in: high G+C Gram-positive bacteria) TaxID=192944 RepID=UPI00364C4A0A